MELSKIEEIIPIFFDLEQDQNQYRLSQKYLITRFNEQNLRNSLRKDFSNETLLFNNLFAKENICKSTYLLALWEFLSNIIFQFPEEISKIQNLKTPENNKIITASLFQFLFQTPWE